MIGPRKKKMPNKFICRDCEVLVSKTVGGTVCFPKKRVVNYCNHKALGGVAFIKAFPYTPEWCPALKINSNLRIGEERGQEKVDISM